VIRKTGYLGIIVALSLMGCAGHHTLSNQDQQDGKIFWSHRYQYVRLIPQAHCPGVPVVANSHPQDLDGRLQSALASMRIDLPDQDKTAPVFTRSDLEKITGPLLRAFKKAAPDEDVALAVEGMHPGNFGLERSVVTARMFIQNGNTLQVIFGKKLYTPIEDYDPLWHAEPRDYRLSPFLPGSRCQRAGKKFPAIIATSTVQLHKQDGNVRKNWLTVSLAEQPQPPQVPMPTAMPPAAHPPTATTPPAVQGTQGMPRQVAEPHEKTLEEKLQILKNLKDKGLITDQEYKEKKKEILDSL
jgi:Short C-terminal domain